MPRDDAGKTTEQIKLFELYDKDPDLADRLIFGRVTHKDRRGFLRGAGLATMAAILGTGIPFHRTMPSGFVPVAMAATEGEIKGKDGLTVLNDRPVNAETPAHLLDDEVTPTSRHFIRNNGIPPEDVDAGAWELTLDGLVDNPMTLSIADLKSKFEVVTEQLIIECGGNGRAFFEPPAKGNQWSYGAVACSEWTGVRLRDVLQAAGVKSNVVYTAHVGADSHLSGEEGKLPISRGVPIEKAMNPHNLIAFGQNGAEMHPMNGAPLRLVVPGWPGSCSQKSCGGGHQGSEGRLPDHRGDAGEIAHYQSSDRCGSRCGRAVDLSIDFGATWIKADLQSPRNPYAWQRFSKTISFPMTGYYEVWARATDSAGRMQPFAIAWNPKGYLNNSMHRVSVTVS
jgi:DMSO/TMAO reductase YedYZ molybdopterin-dependent catalytic subunit